MVYLCFDVFIKTNLYHICSVNLYRLMTIIGIGRKNICFAVFNSCDVLKPHVAHIGDIFKYFTSYKVRVPITGAIILDETYERVRQE